MKTVKLFFLIIVPGMLSIPAVKAQNIQIDFGIKAGLNVASLQTNRMDISENNWKSGYNVGAFARIGNRWYFQPEFAYRLLQNEYTFQTKKYNPAFNQVNLPLMVGYKIINNEGIKFRMSIGPDLTYNLNKPESPSAIVYHRFIVGGLLDAGVDIGNISIDVSAGGNVTQTTKFNANDFNNFKNENDRGIFTLSISYKIL
jgi:hypothetical protein